MPGDDQVAATPAQMPLLRRWHALGPDVGMLVMAPDDDGPDRPLISWNEDVILEMGSVFKLVLLAAFARQVEGGDASWHQTFMLTPDVRISHSELMGNLPDGHEIAARDLLVAMMGPSDNTATQMMIDWLPDGAIDELIGLAGLTSTMIDPDLRTLYAHSNADALFEPRSCRSTVADMVRFYQFALSGRFYQFALSGRLLTNPAVDATFRDILGSEDRDQGFVWGSGITCLRKSGYVAPPPLLAIGFAGALLGGPEPLVFAFALNRNIGEEAGRDLAAAFGPVVRDTLLWALAQGATRLP